MDKKSVQIGSFAHREFLFHLIFLLYGRNGEELKITAAGVC